MSEYLSEEEQLAQLKSVWQSYGWWVIGAVVLGLGGYFALEYMASNAKAHNSAASEVFERYQENPADEAAARPLLARLDGEYAGTPYQKMALLTRAQLATDADDIEAAVGFYEAAVAGEAVEHLTDLARLRLARSLQQLGRSDDAFAALATVSGEGYRSLVAELKGDILRTQDKLEEAREAYAAAVAAQGDDAPRTLLAMKLADLSAPEGGLAGAPAAEEAQEAQEPQEPQETSSDALDDAEAVDEVVPEAAEALNEAAEALNTKAAEALDMEAAEALENEVPILESEPMPVVTGSEDS